MKAMYQILLPYELHLLQGEYGQVGFTRGPYKVVVHRPIQAQLRFSEIELFTSEPTDDLLERLRYEEVQRPTSAIKFNDTPVFRANLLVIEFERDHFDRNLDHDKSAGPNDPPLHLALEIANDVLRRLRTVSQSPFIRYLDPERVAYRIQYSDSSAGDSKLGEYDDLAVGPMSFAPMFIGPETWAQSMKLTPGFRPQAWNTLILDALSILSEPGAAIVLAAAALEAFSSFALDVLAQEAKVQPALWDWIINRNDFRARPSTEERFGILLEILAGESLATLTAGTPIWESYKNLKTARNTLVHKGVAMIGDKPIGRDKVEELVHTASEIIDAVEKLLPATARRQTVELTGDVKLRTRVKDAISATNEFIVKDPVTGKKRYLSEEAHGFRAPATPAATSNAALPPAKKPAAKPSNTSQRKKAAKPPRGRKRK